jgi:AmiR/NasT family two-component response regulator
MNSIKRVVILENDGIIALDLKSLMLEIGFEEVEIIKNFSGLFQRLTVQKPDLIIVDSFEEIMPEQINVLKNVYHLPVILLTDLPDHMLDNVIREACSLVRKPYRKHDLVNVLKQSS